MNTPPNLIAVQSRVAASLLIDGLFDEAVARSGDPLPTTTQRTLDACELPTIARLGYLARVIELERFEAARAPVPWLVQFVSDRPEQSLPELATQLASEEPLEKSPPASGAPLWRVPGPGGHVRHFLAARSIGTGPPERKRAWAFGFLLRCCQDAGDQLGSTECT